MRFPWQRKVMKFRTLFITVFLVVLMVGFHPRFDLQKESRSLKDFRNITEGHELSKSSINGADKNDSYGTFKFYIYDLPKALNVDILRCINSRSRQCFDLSQNGFGSEIFRIGNNKDISVCDTHQFSLEVILHNKLQNNRLRTLNPQEADLFYIPAYMGLMSFCNRKELKNLTEILKNFLSKSASFTRGKPHFSAAAKIEREMVPYFKYDFTSKITFLGIERSYVPSILYMLQRSRQIIVSPYPSYVHFINNSVSFATPNLSERDIFILLPVGQRRSNPDRARLMDQFNISTKQSYLQFKTMYRNKYTEMILYYTNECSHRATHDTIPWMMKSVFCLQPPGDSPTRKSFYDSILSGCIPVIFIENGNPYSFQKYLNFSTFSVSIPFINITRKNQSIYEILKKIDAPKLIDLHVNVMKVAKHMQYSIDEGKWTKEDDALQLLFTELSEKFKLPYDRNMYSHTSSDKTILKEEYSSRKRTKPLKNPENFKASV